MTASPDLGDAVRRARSLLFVPGDRPDRFDKAQASGCDAVILDLEDAVGPEEKDAARTAVSGWLEAGGTAVVRINAVGTPWYDQDVAMLAGRGATVMLPKAERAEEVTALLTDLGPASGVVALVETAAGVLGVAGLCTAPGLLRVAFGSVDLGAQLGVDPEHAPAMAGPRSVLVIASAAVGLPAPIDAPSLDLSGPGGRAGEEALAALATGFGAKLCVHPNQVAAVNEAFTPSSDELDRAREIVAAAGQGGVVRVRGRMVDKPVIERAARLLEQSKYLLS
jgi:citrate lyase subunit beta/citryl-CoA lyase